MGNFAKKMNKMKKIDAVGKSMEEFYRQTLNNLDYLKRASDEMRLVIGFQQKMIDHLLGKEYCEAEFEAYKDAILKEIAEEEAKRKAAETGENVVKPAEIDVKLAENGDIPPESMPMPV